VSIKYTIIFHCKTLQNLPKIGFLVWKQTIWQPWISPRKDEKGHSQKDTFSQGYEIFLGTTNQTVKNIPNGLKLCMNTSVDGALSSSGPKMTLYWTTPWPNLIILLMKL
jgi:hypothetical protein